MIRQKDGFCGERILVLPQMIVKMMEDDPLCAALHITDIGYYPKARHHFRERKEPINQYVFIYCIDGAGEYSVFGNRYNVTSNQYFILPAGVPHLYKADEDNPWTIYWIHFKGSLAPFYVGDNIRTTEINTKTNSRISDRINIFEEMFTTLSNGYSKDNLHYVSAIFHGFLGSLRYIQQYRDANNATVDAEDIVAVAIHYMKENIEKRLSLKDISDFIGYSPSHFSALFKKQIGHAPLAYLNLLKVQRACQMLDETDMKISQICHKIGIDDPYYFSRLFSKIMRLSPSEYRLENKG